MTVISSSKDKVEQPLTTLPGSAAGQVADVTSVADLQRVFDGSAGIDHLVFTAGEPLLVSGVGSLSLTQPKPAGSSRRAISVPSLRSGTHRPASGPEGRSR